MAAGTIQQIITLKGQDEASRTVDGVKGKLRDLAGSTRSSFKDAAETSGDLEKGLLGVRDILGDLPGPVQALADNFGGAEKLLQIMPGPIGLVGAGLVAAGAAAFTLYQESEKAKNTIRVLGNEDTQKLADSMKITVEQAVAFQRALTEIPQNLKDQTSLVNDIVENAKVLNKESADAIKAFAGATDPAKLIDFQKEFGNLGIKISDVEALAAQLGVTVEELGFPKQAEGAEKLKLLTRDIAVQEREVAKLTKEYVDKITEANQLQTAAGQQERARLDLVLATASAIQQRANNLRAEAKELVGILALEKQRQRATSVRSQAEADGRQRVALLQSKVALETTKEGKARAQQAADAVARTELAASAARLEADIKNNAIDQVEAGRERIRLQIELNQLEGQAIARQEASARKGGGGGGGGKSKAQIEAEKAAAAAKQAAEDAKVAQERQIQRAEQSADALRRLQNAQIDSLEGAERYAAERERLVELATVREYELELELVTNAEALANEKLALQQDLANKLKALDDAEKKRKADIREALKAELKQDEEKAAADREKKKQQAAKDAAELIDQQRNLWSTINNIVGPAVAAFAGDGGIGGALSQVVAESQKLAAQWKGEGVGADAIIGSVGAVASAVVEGEKEKAAILALTSAAQAAVFYATGQIPQAVAATAAAALYGAAAGGLIGGSTPAATGGGGFAAAPAMGGGGGFGGGEAVGGTTTVINFNAPLGTPYEIGKSVAKAQKAASAGGWSPRMAMGV